MTPAQYRALGKRHDTLQHRIQLMDEQKEVVREKLRERYAKAERVVMKRWNTRIAKLEKQLKVIENRLEYYEHA